MLYGYIYAAKDRVYAEALLSEINVLMGFPMKDCRTTDYSILLEHVDGRVAVVADKAGIPTERFRAENKLSSKTPEIQEITDDWFPTDLPEPSEKRTK